MKKSHRTDETLTHFLPVGIDADWEAELISEGYHPADAAMIDVWVDGCLLKYQELIREAKHRLEVASPGTVLYRLKVLLYLQTRLASDWGSPEPFSCDVP